MIRIAQNQTCLLTCDRMLIDRLMKPRPVDNNRAISKLLLWLKCSQMLFSYRFLFCCFCFILFWLLKVRANSLRRTRRPIIILSKQFAGNLSFKVAEPLNGAAPIVAPRSIMVQRDALLPGSFLGCRFCMAPSAGFWANGSFCF